jgi:hypothetical protein
MYGGAVGGGKTEALEMAPLRYIHHPKHRAIILRRNKDMLREVVDRGRELYPQVAGGVWNETRHRFEFPSGAKIQMGYADNEREIERYRTFEFNMVCFDELTEFTEFQYKFMLSRNRSKSADLPLLMRSGTNPGGLGMGWVDQRFIGSGPRNTQKYDPYTIYKHDIYVEGMGNLSMTRQFIPSTVFDNPHVHNSEDYIAGLADMDPEEREAYLYGRWGKFRGQFFLAMPKETEPRIKQEWGPWYVIRGMDYGWSDPSCVLWVIVYPEVGKLEVAAELYSPRLTTDGLATLIQATEHDLGFGPDKIVHSVLSPDAHDRATSEGGPTIQVLLSQSGVWFTKANNDRINGWQRLQQLIARDKIRVWRGRAPNLMRTLPKLPRDRHDGRDVQKRGVEDHAPEALRYIGMAYYDTGGEAPPKPKDARPEHKDPYWEAMQAELRGAHKGFIPGFGEGW